MLELAVRMVEKGLGLVAPTRTPSHEELGLLLGLLQDQAKFEEALTALRSYAPSDQRGQVAAIEDEESVAEYNIVPISDRGR
jgi:hypothetical protein